MDQNSFIWIGSIGGILLGVLGGMLGTWCSIRNTSGPRERAFMVRTAAVMWLLISFFLLLLYFLAEPWNRLIWIPYTIALTTGIHYCNRRQQSIREAEAANHQGH
ncbi:hypothetical protein [Gimesia panareensis]|uniref:hypothetical protein n=1 Tax=Gimesia panareensis TaxID=2527978 RepID=UPI001188DEAC|nr:hypothetical protein [Gimesia panareensis]QDU49806.1 hypothetical protein Pan110_21450 [Gimesia panareensis]